MDQRLDLDPDVRKLPIELTEPVDPGPAESMTMDTEDEVKKYLAQRKRPRTPAKGRGSARRSEFWR